MCPRRPSAKSKTGSTSTTNTSNKSSESGAHQNGTSDTPPEEAEQSEAPADAAADEVAATEQAATAAKAGPGTRNSKPRASQATAAAGTNSEDENPATRPANDSAPDTDRYFKVVAALREFAETEPLVPPNTLAAVCYEGSTHDAAAALREQAALRARLDARVSQLSAWSPSGKRQASKAARIVKDCREMIRRTRISESDVGRLETRTDQLLEQGAANTGT